MHMQEPILHAEIQKFFLGLMDRKQLGHAYCFVGPKYVGKKRIAFEIIAKILHTSVEHVSRHPDFLVVEQELNEKTGKTKKNIDIEQIQIIREFCSTLPMQSEKKVVIICGAEKLHTYSSNALLKTLEEPKGNTVFFLLTEDEHALLSTIRSRVQIMYLHPQSTEKIFAFLQQQGVEQPLAQSFAETSRGLVEFAVELKENSQNYHQEKQRFLGLFGQPLYKKLQDVEVLFGDKKDSIFTREQLQRVLDFWQIFNREKFLHAVHEGISEQTFFLIHEKIEEAKKFLEKNVHPRLLVEQILIEIP